MLVKMNAKKFTQCILKIEVEVYGLKYCRCNIRKTVNVLHNKFIFVH